MKKYLFIALILLFKPALGQQVALQTLLNEMIDEEAVVRWPKPFYVLKEVSSYDQRSVSPIKPGWFANDDYSNFIRMEEKQNGNEYVMFDADGPGAIVRFWLTTTAKPGKMRFYFDNEEKPSLEIPAFDLMKAGFNLGPGLLQPHSSYQPKGIGGNTLYLPLPYQKHCKITWTEPDMPQVTGGLLFGFDTGVISGALPFLKQYWKLSVSDVEWLALAQRRPTSFTLIII